MNPAYQTRYGQKDGNCFAACVASILERQIEDVDVDHSTVRTLSDLLPLIELKANCKVHYANHEAIQEGFFKTSERYCIVEVCAIPYGGNDPYHEKSIWHGVVCKISDSGKIEMVHNPASMDYRQKSLDEFIAIRKAFFVKPNSSDKSNLPMGRHDTGKRATEI